MPDIRGTIVGTLASPGSIQWLPGFRASVDEKGKWTATHSFECKSGDVTRLLPKSESACTQPGYSFLKLYSADITDNNNTSTVNRDYGKYSGSDGDFNFEDGGDDPFTYELGITTSEELLETNPRYKDIPTNEKLILQKYQAGILQQETETANSFVPTSDPSGTPEVIESDLGIEFVSKLNDGKTSYLKPGQIWRGEFLFYNPLQVPF